MKAARFAVLALAAAACCSAAHDNWKELRGRIAGTLRVPQPLPNLQLKSYGKFSPAAGVEADRVSYSTGYSLRVPAIVYHEAGPTITKHPALIVVNGHRGDKSSWYAYWAGILFARAGAVVLTYDPIGEYERNKDRLSRTGQHDEYLSPDDAARRLSGLMITDVMQAVTALSERPDVDAKRIAVLGYSMGSFVSSLACAIDSRIHACVLAGGGDLDGPGGYWDNSNKMCQGIPYRSLSFLGDRGPAIFASNAKRGATLIINGTDDQVVDIPHHGKDWFEVLRRQTIEKAGRGKNIFDVDFEAGGGHRPYFLTRPAALWLEEKLKFPNWTREQIENMPATRITDWITKTGADIGKDAARELHEGGTMALGANIPAVPRDQLHAVPEAVWDAESRDYVYETWVERVQAAIRSGAP